MSEQTTDLTIVRKENVQMIAQSAPQIYKDNTTSSKRCSEYGQKLLAQIKANGMNDELDMQCANYINKARNTVKKMNTNRFSHHQDIRPDTFRVHRHGKFCRS